jgi:hypothetical protein
MIIRCGVYRLVSGASSTLGKQFCITVAMSLVDSAILYADASGAVQLFAKLGEPSQAGR